MNLLYRFLFPSAIAICLGLQGPSSWAGALQRGGVVELGKLKSRVPADWVKESPDGPFGYRQYHLPPVNDDKSYALVTIDFLANGGDSAEKQVERWKAMFLPPERKKMDDVAKVQKFNVSGVAVTYLDVRGDYKGIPGDPTSPRQDFRLLGVYFPTPQGLYLISMFGPGDTVAAYRKGFEDWVKAFK
jgi:hypothetical protein